jgi:hypothetical protein
VITAKQVIGNRLSVIGNFFLTMARRFSHPTICPEQGLEPFDNPQDGENFLHESSCSASSPTVYFLPITDHRSPATGH